MASIGGMFRSFWHTMTSYDRHASAGSSYTIGKRNSTSGNRHAPLTSITTSAGESRTDLTAQESSGLTNNYNQNSLGGQSPVVPYSPGMRSTMQRTQSSDDTKSMAQPQIGEIQMQNFSEGLPPPPPVSHSWKRIDRWAEVHYQELFDNLGGGCTQNDINELEHELDCTLPQEVRDSLQFHDGQERGGLPTGILFGSMLLDCEEIVQEWKNWRQVNDQYLTQQTIYQAPQIPLKAFAGPSSSSGPAPASQQSTNPAWREELLSRQDAQPPNSIQKAYAHPAWIPLARDWGGNCLAVDLAPGPAGKWGQVILMGRDYDCKYVVSRSWAAFLATFADDLSSDKTYVIEDSGDLMLREFPKQGVNPAYFDILRWRADQKYGRKGAKKRPADPRTASNGVINVSGSSPYSGRTAPELDRGRSPQRGAGKTLEKRISRGQPVSSPLARVNEELPAAVKVHSNSSLQNQTLPEAENLIAADTPRVSHDSRVDSLSEILQKPSIADDSNKENGRPVGAGTGLGVTNIGLDGTAEHADGLKTVDI